MQVIFYLLAACLFSIDWLADVLGLLPDVATFFPELFAVIFATVALFVAVRHRSIDIDLRTLLILSCLLATYLASILVNHLEPGVLINGVRAHMKFLPFFILPMVYQFAREQIRKQLILLLGLSILQSFVAFYQRFVTYAGHRSGDPIGGTLGANTSGILSVWLACAIALVFAFYLAKEIKTKTLILLLILLASPMMLNETKISFLILPVALLIPAVFSSTGKGRLVRLALSTCVTVALLVALVNVYESFRPQTQILDWFTSEEATEYVYQGSTAGGRVKDVKRLDAIKIAYEKLRHENSLALGLGPGNLSPAFERRFEGEFYRRYLHFQPLRNQLSASLWETGLTGTILLVLLTASCGWSAFRLTASRAGNYYRPLAIGWIAVTAIMLVTLSYFNTFIIDLFASLFWFYSGVIVAAYSRQQRVAIDHLAVSGHSNSGFNGKNGLAATAREFAQTQRNGP